LPEPKRKAIGGYANLVNLQPYVLLLPSIKGLFGNSNPSDQLSERNSRFYQLSDGYELFEVEAFLFHGNSPFFRC